jgi:4-aminobutyrate aminotransferase
LSVDAGASVEGDINQSYLRTRWQAEHLGAETQDLLRRDSEVFLRQSLSTPCLNALAKTEGSWLIDVEGRRYLDFHGNSVHQVGYGHPKVVQALVDQLQVLPFCPRRYTNEPAILLGERLAEVSPGELGKVLLAPGGAEAVGIALKIARIATGRFKTLSMWDSFHGASLDTISIGGESLFRRDLGPLLPGSEHVPPPDPIRCPLGCQGVCNLSCASYLEYVLDKEGDIAAVVAEPVRCTTVVAPPPEYWKRIRAACNRNGAILIFDEIPVCLGRTGKLFATELTGVVPDILVCGKGLGGGIMPLAAVVAHPDLDVAEFTALGHYTHEKSPVAAAVALATLDVIQEEGLVERSRVLGDQMVKRLRCMNHPWVVDVRGLGLLIGVELRDPRSAEEVLYSCLSEGLSFKVSSGTVLTLTPPLTLSDEEADASLSILNYALGKL